MTDAATLSAEQLLAIATPEELYPRDDAGARELYLRLSTLWHPDKRAGGTPVFQHVAALYDQAAAKLRAGAWLEPGAVYFKTKSLAEFRLRFQRRHAFELGEAYVADERVLYLVDGAYRDLYEAAHRRVKSFRFDGDEMRAECARYLPSTVVGYELADGRFALLVRKTPDLVCLADLLHHLSGRVDPRHVAWIISSLLNLRCYLRWARLAHNDISPATYFVSPQHHSGALLGGWWYAAGLGEKLVALPARSARVTSASPPAGRTELDGDLIRLTGRELLGDAAGSKLLLDKTVPAPMRVWLRSPASDNPFQEYRSWMTTVLKESFGVRRFAELKVTASDIYDRST